MPYVLRCWKKFFSYLLGHARSLTPSSAVFAVLANAWAGFRVHEMRYDRRLAVNRATRERMYRVWLVAVLSKPAESPVAGDEAVASPPPAPFADWAVLEKVCPVGRARPNGPVRRPARWLADFALSLKFSGGGFFTKLCKTID